ncbi:MAG TPA: nitroreductase family protein, partial [Prevotella sp.]
MTHSAKLSMAFSAAILFLCMGHSLHATAQGNGDARRKTVMNNILTRTSVRAYQSRSVEKDKIQDLLRAGMAAPSAVDRRPWHFVVVTDKSVLEGLSKANPNAGMAAHAPLAIVVCGDMTKALTGRTQEYWIQDASAATENILLAANGMGLGAVWTGTYPSKERMQAVVKVLHLPEHIVPLNTIVIGYPYNDNEPKNKFDATNISYNSFGGAEPAPDPAAANSANEFNEFNVLTDFNDNPFTFFGGPGLLLAAGSKDQFNEMTIGWGTLGTLWGSRRPVATVYVAKKRYTREFMEKNKYFTIMHFKDEKILEYMGTKSGRNTDKAKDLGLHVKYTDNGTPYFEEADMVIECETMYADEFNKKAFRNDVPKEMYDNFPAG